MEVKTTEIVGTFERSSKNREIYGFVHSQDKNYDVSTLEASSKAIVGDLVSYDIVSKKITKILKRTNTMISGVLQISSRTIEGYKKGEPMKRFVPTDKRYPPFRVKVPKRKITSVFDAYVIIKFSDWPTGQNIPDGTLEQFIGEVGDPVAELEYLKWRHGLRWKKLKKIDMSQYMHDITPERRDLTDCEVYTVDPDGCRDVDDGLHVRQISDKVYEIGVHIADVSSYISEGSLVDLEAMNRIETSYLAQEQTNMLPDEFATDLCSLISGSPKRAFSILFTVSDDSSYKIEWIGKSLIQVKENITYEQAEERTKKEDPALKLMFSLASRLSQGLEDSFDWHKVVENYMVLANKTVAEIFNQKIPDSGLFRRHTGTPMPQFGNNISELLRRRAFIRKLERAEYVVGPDHRHNSLELDHYTHFTSPIRRYADIIVHRLLYQLLTEKEPLKINQELCHYINEKKKDLDKAQRESHLLATIFKIYQDQDSIIDRLAGFVVAVDDNYVQIYLPELDVEGTCKIIPHKLKHIVKYTSNEDEIKTEDGVKLKLYDRINVQVIISMKAHSIKRKLILKITR